MKYRAHILESVQAVLGATPGLAVIHSSLGKLAPEIPLKPWDILSTFEHLVKEGWTFAFPAFTFSFCEGKPFDEQLSSSETGVLADWILRKVPEAKRTDHPIYSFVVWGPQSDDIIKCDSITTFGKGSPFELFERENAHLVMMGCGWHYCTQFHRYEELAKVPYRFFKTFKGMSNDQHTSADMYVRNMELNPISSFAPCDQLFKAEGFLRSQDLWRGQIESVRASDFKAFCEKNLTNNPLFFLKNSEEVGHLLAQNQEASSQETLRIAILGNTNVAHLCSALHDQLKDLLPERHTDIFSVPFGQLSQNLIAPQSALKDFEPQISFFCDRFEEVVGEHDVIISNMDATIKRVRIYGEKILDFQKENGGWVYVHEFALLTPSFHVESQKISRFLNNLNDLLHEILDGVREIQFLNPENIAAHSKVEVFDPRLWSIGRYPFSHSFCSELAQYLAGLVLSVIGKTTRLIVLDLDNTLWGGVLGEDGIEGIQLGGDYPGNSFRSFQKALKSLSESGIALAVCSKNDEDLALATMDQHDQMVIKPSDLVAHRINWQPKWCNIIEIAKSLNLGLGSILFIDDNIVEREAVRRHLPEVKILDLSEDPTQYEGQLRHSPWVKITSVLNEDISRIEGYKARSKIENQRKNANNMTEFLQSLDITLSFHPLNKTNIARAGQLCQKTNQFNTTTRRYTEKDLSEIMENGGYVIVIAMDDVYTSRENIGLIVIQPYEVLPGIGQINLFLLSCRVLGRGLETAVLRWACGLAYRVGWQEIRGLIIETPRNTPVRSVFNDSGFSSTEKDGEWVMTLDGSFEDVSLASWFTLEDNVILGLGVDSTDG